MKAVSKTAYYCCGVRMQDAESAHPVIGDNYAKRLMGEEGMKYWEEFKHLSRPNISNTARHYIIDSHLKKQLSDHPNATIIIIGAGLDSRAYRLNSGNWIEIDEPGVIEYKNKLLPVAECKNKLERISIDFEKEKLADKLAPYRNLPNVLIVIEGVLMYLTRAQKETLLSTLKTLFPKHIIFCDLMKKNFFDRFGKDIHEKLSAHGAIFTDMLPEPDQTFLQNGYDEISVISTIQTAIDLGMIKMPKFFVKLFFGKMIMGYAIYTFSYNA